MTFGQVAALIFAVIIFLLMCVGGLAAWLVKDDHENPGRLWQQGDKE